jgi:ribosomal protein L11 methyltransferase
MERTALSRAPLFAITVTVPSSAEEPVAALMERLWGEAPVLTTDLRRHRTEVAVFCQRRGAWSKTHQSELRAGLRRLREAGLLGGRAPVCWRRVARENWAASWKHHFPPLEIGRALLIRPSWSAQRARPGQRVVVLDPGLSFGTGHHPTTEFCLRQLVACRVPGRRQSFLDVGTGTGILAISAAKLGYAPVEGFDNYPEAVRIAQRNARRNGVGDRVRLRGLDLARLPLAGRRYDVIGANLAADVLLAHADRLVRRLKPAGRLIVAGVLRAEFRAVQGRLERAGLRRIAWQEQAGWKSGTFARPDGERSGRRVAGGS